MCSTSEWKSRIWTSVGAWVILGKDHLDEGRIAGRGLALFDLGQVSFVEFGMVGHKDAAARTVYVAGDTLLETEVAFRGLAQNIAQALSGQVWPSSWLSRTVIFSRALLLAGLENSR